MDTIQRIQKLREELTLHNYMYHTANKPVITDAEYDSLYRDLVDLEKLHPETVDPLSPTQRVGAPLTGAFVKRPHAKRMLSLANAYSAKEVKEWFKEGDSVWIEPKIDGLSLKLVYTKGEFTQAVTRGDGSQGDDVTANARTIRTIPLALLDPIDLVVTGEVYMTYTVFNELNAQLEADGEEPFANSRNAASGALKLKDPAEVAKRRLAFVVHGCVSEINDVARQDILIEYLEAQGFQSTRLLPTKLRTATRLVTISDASKLSRLLTELDKERKHLDLATDGLVFKLTSLEKQRDLGEGTKYPNWAVAYKYPPEQKATTLLGITLQVGKSGRITPVAELQPLELGGTTVRRASLCNADEIARLGVDVGDEVTVVKSAEIIPKLLGVKEKHSTSNYVFPSICPCCKARLIRLEGMVDWYCPNKLECREQVFGRLKYATSKQALNLVGCGDAMIEALMDAGVKKLSDLFALQDVKFLKDAARKTFMEGREQAKKQPLWRKLVALGVEGFGQTLSQEAAARWSSLLTMLEHPAELEAVLGKVVYTNLMNYLFSESAELERLHSLGLIFEDVQRKEGCLTGKVFVITGGLASGSRDEVSQKIMDAGGIVKTSASRKCHYLVVGEGAGRTKTEAAEKHGIECISEQQLYDLMGQKLTLAPVRDPDHEF